MNKYIHIPWDMAKNFDIGSNELLVYALISGFSATGNKCTMSQKTIAEVLGITDKTVRNVLCKLLEKGLIKKVGYNKEFQTVEYIISNKGKEKNTYTSTEKNTEGIGKNYRSSTEKFTDNNIKDNTNILSKNDEELITNLKIMIKEHYPNLNGINTVIKELKDHLQNTPQEEHQAYIYDFAWHVKRTKDYKENKNDKLQMTSEEKRYIPGIKTIYEDYKAII